MTSISLHHMPRWRTIAGEQLRVVGLRTRNGGVALVALILVASAMVIKASLQARDLELRHVGNVSLGMVFTPIVSAVFAVIAALYARVIWQDDDRIRRSYHWMMPVDPRTHALAKVLAGLMWMLAATALSMVSIALVSALSSTITGHPQLAGAFAWWVWIVPFTSATIAYLLVSAACVGARQPHSWIVGLILLYGGALLALDGLGYRDAHGVLRTAFGGEYGVSAALFGQIDRLNTAQLQEIPSAARWLGASALWGGLALLLLGATSGRRTDHSFLGERPAVERPHDAIMRFKWLIASVVAIAAAGGLLATRLVKPEYEARATIWLGGRPSGPVPAYRLSDAEASLGLLRASRITDSVVQRLGLYVRPGNDADAFLLKDVKLAELFWPGDYTFAVDDRGARWQLRMADVPARDSGAVGDSVGRVMGLRWLPEPATLAKFAGRQISFSLMIPHLVSANLQTRTRVVRPANGSFLQLAVTDVDPKRAAAALNAISSEYVAQLRAMKAPNVAVLDSAVAPFTPFKNSPSQLFGASLIVGVAAALGLVLFLVAFQSRTEDALNRSKNNG
jgi:capsular polysaccharide biosynthesis protein